MPFLQEPEPHQSPPDPFTSIETPFFADFFGGVRDGLYWLWDLAREAFVPVMLAVSFFAFAWGIYTIGVDEGRKTDENVVCVTVDEGPAEYRCIPVSDEMIEAIRDKGLSRG